MSVRTTLVHYELFMDIIPTARNDQTPPLTNLTIFDIFNHLKANNYEGENRIFGHNRFCGLLPVINIHPNNDRIDLLLCLSNKEADNPETLDFQNREIETLQTGGNKGVNTRCHIVIKPNQNDCRHAYFIIEYRLGVTAKLFVDTLNYFIADLRRNHQNLFVGNHPTARNTNGAPQEVQFKCKFKYETVFSEEMVNAFAQGRIENIIFNKPIINSHNYDPNGVYTTSKETVHLDISANVVRASSNTYAQILNDIRASLSSLATRNGLPQGMTFTIKFRDDNGSQRTAHYDLATREFSLAKKTYTNRQRINDQMLNIDNSFCDRMFGHL